MLIKTKVTIIKITSKTTNTKSKEALEDRKAAIAMAVAEIKATKIKTQIITMVAALIHRAIIKVK